MFIVRQLLNMKVIPLHHEEQQWIAQAKELNRQAQQRIYQHHAPKMLSVCRQYVKDIHHAEDVMITAFMKVFTNLKSFENKGSFEGWIRRIMIHECISFIRVQKKVNYTEDYEFSEPLEDEEEMRWTAEELQKAIDVLPEGYKMVFNLYVVEGLKHHEISKMLGISEGTSKSQLSHAKTMLRKILNSYEKKSKGQGI
jgi:RNA polymerase sigma-70 factor, ECF subfamily